MHPPPTPRLFLIWFFVIPPLLDLIIIYYRYHRLEGLHITLSEMNPALVEALDRERDDRLKARQSLHDAGEA